MLVGTPSLFALESEITEAYERLSLRGLGYFVIHVNGMAFGMKDLDATLLAAAFDGVNARILRQGSHVAPVLENEDAYALAVAYSRAIYLEHEESELFFGMQDEQFSKLLHANEIIGRRTEKKDSMMEVA